MAAVTPSGRSLLIAFAVLAGAALCYVAARETALFAVRQVQVAGAPPDVAATVERALAPTRGSSLLAVDLAEARAAVLALPTVAFARFDKAYPHTLSVRVVPERPAAVVRQGAAAYVVSARGRVVAKIDRTARPRLARIWFPATTGPLTPGETVDGDLRIAVRAVTPLAGRRFPAQVISVRASDDELTLRLRSGLEVYLGDARDVPLKLVVARRVIPLLQPGARYLDLSVPERPVAGIHSKPQLELYTGPST